MKKLLKYMRSYKIECILGPLFKLIEAALELLVPYIILNIINIGIVNNDQSYIIHRSLLLVAMGLLGLGFSISAQYFSAKAAVGFSAKVREDLFSHIMNLGYPEIDKTGKSTFITRLTSDINQVQNGVNLTLRLFLRSPFIVFGSMICAFSIDRDMAFIFVVAIPILAAVVFAIMLSTIPLYKKVQGKLDVILSKTRENLSGVRMLRALCKEKEEIKDFDNKNNDLNKSQNFVDKISSMLNPLTYIIINLAIVVLIYKGALKVQNGSLSQAAVIALYNYMSLILVELIKLANLIITITKSVACGNRIESVMETEASIITEYINNNENYTNLNDIQKIDTVEFKNVSFKYQESSGNSISDISFTANSGQTIGVIGGTGAGKTTLINLLCRFYDVTDGSIQLNGVNINKLDLSVLRNIIRIVPQEPLLFRGSVRENIKFGNENASDDEIWASLDIAQAGSFIREKPGMLDYEIEQGGKNLSGGQKQRITIARAILRKPRILIFDNSTSSLDNATDLAFRRAIKTLDYNPIIFIVLQRASQFKDADKILVLDEGRLSGIGTHSELYNNCLTYREICDSQSRIRRKKAE